MIKRYALTIFLAALMFCLSILSTAETALAHGGVDKVTGKIIVSLTQSPISPLVGEQVKMTFVVTDLSRQKIPGLEVQLRLIDTFFGDAVKDQVLLSEKKITDSNGAFEFEYVFFKENYFDVDLSFKDPATNEQAETGFLIQPRKATNTEKAKDDNVLIFTIGGILIGLIFGLNINVRRSKLIKKT